MSERNRAEVVSSEKKWPNWNERIYNRDHKLTPRIKKFCYLYVTTIEKLTLEEFSEKFKVNVSTIIRWLAWPQTQNEISRLLQDTEARVMALLESRQEEIVKGLLKMFKNEKLNPEVRRKIAYNLLSFGKLRDANVRGMIVSQQTAVVSQYASMTDEQLDEAIKELDELENG